MTGAAGERSGASIAWREAVRDTDVAAIRSLVEETGVFSPDEIAIAGELAEQWIAEGEASGYHFVVAECDGTLAAYACYGPIPGTEGSFDLYWIAVRPACQRLGLARDALARAEAAAFRRGARRMFIDTSATPLYAPARALYLAAGYRQVALIEDFYRPGDGKAIFAKALP